MYIQQAMIMMNPANGTFWHSGIAWNAPGAIEGRRVGGTGTPWEWQCCSPEYRWDDKCQRLEGRNHRYTTHHRDQIWPGIFFELQHSRPQLKRRRSLQNGKQGEREHRPEGGMGSVLAGKGARGRASEFPRSEQSHTRKQGPKRGATAMRTAGANTKLRDTKPPGIP